MCRFSARPCSPDGSGGTVTTEWTVLKRCDDAVRSMKLLSLALVVIVRWQPQVALCGGLSGCTVCMMRKVSHGLEGAVLAGCLAPPIQ